MTINDEPTPIDHVRRFGPSALIGVLALIFVFQNTQDTAFEFLRLTFTWPLWLMLVVFALVGAVVFWGAARRRRKRRE